MNSPIQKGVIVKKQQIEHQLSEAQKRLVKAALAKRSIVAATRSVHKWTKLLQVLEREEEAARQDLYRQADLVLGRLAAAKLPRLPAIAAEWAEELTRTAPEGVLGVLRAQGWFPIPEKTS
jgi:predicted Holliday junction resolvase-like endonuclease